MINGLDWADDWLNIYHSLKVCKMYYYNIEYIYSQLLIYYTLSLYKHWDDLFHYLNTGTTSCEVNIWLHY